MSRITAHNKPMHAEPATLRNFCGVATLLYTTKIAPLRWPGDWGVMFSQRTEYMPRIVLILLLIVMAIMNVILDFSRGEFTPNINVNMVVSIMACGFATAFPAGAAYLISAKTKFKIAGVNIYRLASDFVLGIGLLAWFYLLLIRERPEYYEGASHLYVATWPILLGVIAMCLYLICLTIQGLQWVVKHNKSRQHRPSGWTR